MWLGYIFYACVTPMSMRGCNMGTGMDGIHTAVRDGTQRTPGQLNVKTLLPSISYHHHPQLLPQLSSVLRECQPHGLALRLLPVPPGVDLSPSYESRKAQRHSWASSVNGRVATAHGASSKLLILLPTSLHVPRRLKMNDCDHPSFPRPLLLICS